MLKHRRKTFISYKYHDSSVQPLGGRKSPRAYVTYLQNYSPDISKAEHDNNDNGQLTPNYLLKTLHDRIWDTSITIILISPKMKDPLLSEDQQYIPKEISYSLRTQFRHISEERSQPNALIAVALPKDNTNKPYHYYLRPKTYFINNKPAGKSTEIETDLTFPIIQSNMFNSLHPNKTLVFFPNETTPRYTYSSSSSYIKTVTWNNFIKDPYYYYSIASNHQKNINKYKIQQKLEQ